MSGCFFHICPAKNQPTPESLEWNLHRLVFTFENRTPNELPDGRMKLLKNCMCCLKEKLADMVVLPPNANKTLARAAEALKKIDEENTEIFPRHMLPYIMSGHIPHSLVF